MGVEGLGFSGFFGFRASIPCCLPTGSKNGSRKGFNTLTIPFCLFSHVASEIFWMKVAEVSVKVRMSG